MQSNKKDTKKFQNDIKNYELIRRQLRHIYLYGYYSATDMVQNNLFSSKRNAYVFLQRIKNYLLNDYIEFHQLPNRTKDKNAIRLKYDLLNCPINYLADTFLNCSYNINDLKFYFTFMQMFSYDTYDGSLDINEYYTLEQLFDNYNLSFNDNLTQISNDDGTSNELSFFEFKSRIKELTALEILENKNNAYKLSKDIFSDLTEKEINQLMLFAQFFYNHLFLTIPGYFLTISLNQYLIAENLNETNKIDFTQINPFFFYKKNNLQMVIDDEILWFCLNAIHQLKPISFDYKAKQQKAAHISAFPIKIVIDKYYGKAYLFAHNIQTDKYSYFRLDGISNCKKELKYKYNLITTHEQCHEIYTTQTKNVWSVSKGPQEKEVIIYFKFPENQFDKYLYKLEATKRHGTYSIGNNRVICYKIIVQNPTEMIPWIRSFGPYATIDKTSNSELYFLLKDEFRKVLNNYAI